MRKTLVTVGITVALMVGPGIGMANAQVLPPVGDYVPPPAEVLPINLVPTLTDTLLGLLPV